MDRTAFSPLPTNVFTKNLEVTKHHTVRAQVSPQVGLAYELVCRRYGLDKKALLSLTPLLFVLLAEGSLKWRRRLLDQMSATLHASEELQAAHPHLWFGFLEDRHDWGLTAEEKSIERLDLLGQHAAEGVGEEYNIYLEERITPFLNYLRHLANEIDDLGVVDMHQVANSRGFNWIAERPEQTGCQVCGDELDFLTGGCEKALLALTSGEVVISDIPKEMLSDEATAERVAWLESKVNPDVLARVREYRAWAKGISERAKVARFTFTGEDS